MFNSRYSERSLSQIKDSDLLYDKNPPPFMLHLVFICLVTLCLIVIWSMFSNKTYVVKSTGTIVSELRNFIMSSYSGEITRSYVSEGNYVSAGDVLFNISSTDLELQIKQTEGMIDANKKKIALLERLERYIKDGVNLFDENSPEEKPYYYQYETYMNQVAQKEMDYSAFSNYNYTDEQITIAIRTNEASIAEIYSATLKNIADSIQTLETEINNYMLQLDSFRNGQAQYPIIASTSGIVHMDTEYKEGMVVQAGVAIGSIVAENNAYIAQVYTMANDMPLIHIGDRTDIAISGLTQSIYGTIGGTVSYIASEATVNSENNTSAFLVKIDLDSVYLISNQGNRVNISNGMAVEARIKYDEVTYFNYVLEALGILTR